MADAKQASFGDSREIVVLPFPGPREEIPKTTEFRSTWLTSSLEGLRERGHFDRYLSLLSGHHEEIQTSVAAQWISLEVALAHYDACERLQLDPDEVEATVRTGGNVRRAWYANAIAATQRPGTTVWSVLAQLQKFWLRSAKGGAVQVTQLSAQSARLHYVGCQLFDIAYFREAFRVVLLLLVQHMREDAVMTTLRHSTPNELEYLLRWNDT